MLVASFDWDFERVKMLHHQLSSLMKRECERVRAFDLIAPIHARSSPFAA